jgi:DNA repair exonuclease SbcCD ATPase subunit
MHETDEDQEIEYFKEIARQAETDAEKDLLYIKEILKDADQEAEEDLAYLKELLKEDEHKLEEGVCPMCGQPFSKHGDEEMQAPELVNPSNP